MLFNDKGGNDERAAFSYDTRRVAPGPKIGEIALTESERRFVTLPGVNRAFAGFNRNPYFASFTVEDVTLLVANAHLFYGPASNETEREASIEQRQLEAFAIGRWCDLRRRSKYRFTPNILAVGDFSIPPVTPATPSSTASPPEDCNYHPMRPASRAPRSHHTSHSDSPYRSD